MFKIYGEDQPREEVFLKLERDSCTGDVDLVACDSRGRVLEAGYILGISGKGKLFLYPGLNAQVGFEIDDETACISFDKE